jgi:monoterpene epsilon-lactone hydrolase
VTAQPGRHVPARDLPVPTSVSPEAQAILASPMTSAAPYPAHDDLEGWRAFVKDSEEQIAVGLEWVVSTVTDVEVEETEVDGVPVFVVSPPNLAPDDRRIYLEAHGGALIMGGGANCRRMAIVTAARLGIRTWSVDYRMPPEHPYPAGLDDCVRVYRALLDERQPDEIVVGGSSAGANLAAALVLRARDEGLALPAGLALLSPELDLTESGDSFATNLGVDSVLTQPLMPVNVLYAGDHELADPYLSPLFGDFAAGFPPTFITAGTRDLFLSNAVRMHRFLRSAGIPAELHIMEAGPHAGFFGIAPEDLELDAELRRFLDEQLSG